MAIIGVFSACERFFGGHLSGLRSSSSSSRRRCCCSRAVCRSPPEPPPPNTMPVCAGGGCGGENLGENLVGVVGGSREGEKRRSLSTASILKQQTWFVVDRRSNERSAIRARTLTRTSPSPRAPSRRCVRVCGWRLDACLLDWSVAYQLVRSFVRSFVARAEEGGASGGAAVRPRHLRVRHRWLGYAH